MILVFQFRKLISRDFFKEKKQNNDYIYNTEIFQWQKIVAAAKIRTKSYLDMAKLYETWYHWTKEQIHLSSVDTIAQNKH